MTDTAGVLSIAGVMGGAEFEVHAQTHNVLLEGAAWNFINIRRTAAAQHLASEAGYRFSRGVHPAMAERGVRRCLELMRQWAGGKVSEGLVDNYPQPVTDPVVEVTPADVRRWLGIELTSTQIAELLQRLEFQVEVDGDRLRASTPDHRLDIGTGITGVADLMEEIARIYGYDNIPETRMAASLPPQRNNPDLEKEERLRDLLVDLGFQEIITYRLTSVEREARRLPPAALQDDKPYVRLLNPIAADRNVLRHNLLSSVLEVVERNARVRSRIALFEIGPIFMSSEAADLPDELPRLVIVLTGPRDLPAWMGTDNTLMNFYDFKGVISELLAGLHISPIRYETVEYPSFHPGKSAKILLADGDNVRQLGVMGELHPLVHQNYDLAEAPLLAADLNLQYIFDAIPDLYTVAPVPAFPPVLEDLAVIVNEDVPAERVAQIIQQAAGKLLVSLSLFDVFRGEQIGSGKKSLAYSLTYQAVDRTLSDNEVQQVRQRIVRRLEQELAAYLRR